MTLEQLQSANATFGGTADCTTRGTYDAPSFLWTQSGVCQDTGLNTDSGTVRLTTQANLAAAVDNSGNLLGGAFTLFGTIPDLGLASWSLLASGRLIDVNYGPPVSLNVNPDGSYWPSGGAVSLIALDYVADPLDSFGSILMWIPYAAMVPWNTPGGGIAPWSTSGTTLSNFTGTEYLFFSSETFAPPVPEPSTYALFGIGLLLVFVARKRKLLSKS
jgi:hypothetical protein